MTRQRVANRTATPRNVINDTLRNLRFVQRFNEPKRTQRRKRCRLNHDSISRNQRGRELPGRNRRRKIPRRDQRHRTQRFSNRVTEHLRTFRRNLVSELSCAFAAEVTKDIDRTRDRSGERRGGEEGRTWGAPCY